MMVVMIIFIIIRDNRVGSMIYSFGLFLLLFVLLEMLENVEGGFVVGL